MATFSQKMIGARRILLFALPKSGLRPETGTDWARPCKNEFAGADQ
jgi:hypothetical protein